MIKLVMMLHNGMCAMGQQLMVLLGAFAPTLQEQFADHLPASAAKDIEHLQRDNEAISRLRVRGLIPDGQAAKARDRLTKRVVDLLIHHGAIIEQEG